MIKKSFFGAGVKYASIAVLATLFLVLVISDVWAKTQVVNIDRSYSKDAVNKLDAESLRKEALVQGAIQEINEILNVDLSNPEKVFFKGYLKNRIDDYVLSYSRDRQVITDTYRSLTMNVSLNTRALKELLKTWGIYFTANEKWEYSLQGDIGEKERKEIRLLESMSGLRSKYSGFPTLELHKTGNNIWLGVLKTKENVWTTQDRELYLVWKRLWSNYFSHPDILAKAEESLFVRIGYWASVTGMQSFDNKLEDWEYLLDRAALEHVQIKAEGVSGCWRIETVNPASLKKQLLDYMDSRNLEYSFSAKERAFERNSF